MVKVWMATRNRNKYNEAHDILAELDINLELMEIDRIEIQSDVLSDIAVYSIKQIDNNEKSILIEDAGIFISHYEGFPGPYSSYILKTIDLSGILKLMKDVEDRHAFFESVVAYRDKTHLKCFLGKVEGEISKSIKGARGFGFDPIFIPKDGDGRTFGEMEEKEKNELSHRARAFRSFGKWFLDSM